MPKSASCTVSVISDGSSPDMSAISAWILLSISVAFSSAGDAAHPSSPHHGAGAGIGIEDALALSKLFEKNSLPKDDGPWGRDSVMKAFAKYDAVRRERSQWLVQSSREVCEIYEWRHPSTGKDRDKCFAEIKARSHKLWYFDIEQMLASLEE